MKTLLFVAKPEYAPERVQTEHGILWSCSSKTRAGDEALVYVTGTGIRYRWRVISDAERGRTPEMPWPYACRVAYMATFRPAITNQELCQAILQRDWNAPHANMRVKAASIIPTDVVERIIALRPFSLREVDDQLSKDVEASSRLTDEELARRLQTAAKRPERITVVSYGYRRNADVIVAVLRRANGICEKCRKKAPFLRRSDGSPFLEVHHWTPLSGGGEDTVENAAALCPNCHRQTHHG